jgi:hypothetical protein
VLESLIKYLEVYAYICIVRSIFFAHAVVDVADVVAIAGICLKDSYIYITQQDAPHKDNILRRVNLLP